MPSVTFRGAEIRYLDLRQDEAGVFSRIHMTADLSEPLMEAMGWAKVPDSISTGKLSGAMAATHMILTPNDKEFAKHEMQFNVSEIKDFTFTCEKNDEGRVTGRSVRFVVVSADNGLPVLVENWLRQVGGVSAAAKVGYAVQENIPLQQEESNKVVSFSEAGRRELAQASAAEKPTTDNDLNRMGSGREKKKQVRGGEQSQADATEMAERAAVAKQLAEQLQ
jgi:hypothetical protein